MDSVIHYCMPLIIVLMLGLGGVFLARRRKNKVLTLDEFRKIEVELKGTFDEKRLALIIEMKNGKDPIRRMIAGGLEKILKRLTGKIFVSSLDLKQSDRGGTFIAVSVNFGVRAFMQDRIELPNIKVLVHQDSTSKSYM